MNARETTLAFVQAINAHDVEAVLSLMSDDHVFIDTHNATEDKAAMTTGWPAYFKWFPDYRIEITQLLEEGDTVVIFGYASGTFRGRTTAENTYHWKLPAAWRAVARQGQITMWQVVCDSKIPYEIIDKGTADGL